MQKPNLIPMLIASFVIAGGGAFLGVAVDLGPDRDLGDIRSVTWIVIAVTGMVAAAKDYLAYDKGFKSGQAVGPPKTGSS